jgi:hypothetical protein
MKARMNPFWLGDICDDNFLFNIIEKLLRCEKIDP